MMPGGIAWSLLSGVQISFAAGTWRWTVLQLLVSGALAVLLPVFLLCPSLRKRLTSSLPAQCNVAAHLIWSSSSSSSGGLALQRGLAKKQPKVEHDWGAVTQQLEVSLQPLLGDAAAKQLLQDLAAALAQQDATNEPGPLTYTGGSRLVPVGLKVDAPHTELQALGPPLLGHLSSTLTAGMDQGSTPTAMFTGAAAVFIGCIQLLANVLEILQPSAGTAGGEIDASEQPGPGCSAPEQAQQLSEGAVQVLQAAGSPGYTAAACVQGHVNAAQREGSSTHQAASSPVTLVCLDPPCAAEGAAGALDIHLHINSSSSSSTGRLVVYSAAGLHVDVPAVLLGDTIRLDLPALPIGVYQLALLPTHPPGAPSADHLATACQPLFTHPLLVLPPAAAAELHQYWQAAISAGAMQGVAQAPGQQGALGAADVPCQRLAALQHAWASQLSSMICDIAAWMLSAAAARHTQQQQQQPDSMGVSLGSGTFQPAPFAYLLQRLLLHLCKQRLWELVALVTTPGHSATTGSRAGQCSSGSEAAGGSREAAGATSASLAAAGGGRDSSRGAGSSRGPAERRGGRVPAPQGSSSSSSSSRSGAAAATQLLGAAEELAACGTWAGRWRQLSAGFSSAALEARYLEYVYDTTLPADVANVPVFMIVVAGHGVFTDPYDTLTPQWQQVTARLLFAALFCVPSILVLAYRPRLRHGNRRERARSLTDAGMVLTACVIIFGRLYTLHNVARMLDNSWRTWAITVAGQGAFTTCCRQTRTRAWLRVGAYEYLSWGTAAALSQGRLLPAVLRYLCVAAAALACSVVMELRSRRCFCQHQVLQAREAAAGEAAAAGCSAAGKGKVEDQDKCHLE